MSGTIGFYATTEYTLLHLYSPDFSEIDYIETDPGYVEFDLNLMHLGAGTYYLAVEAYDYPVDPYFIDMNIVLTEKSDTITLTEVTPDLLSMYPLRCWVESDIAYFVGRTGAWAFDVSDKTDPALLGHCQFNHNFDVRGAAYYQGHLYFSYYNTDFSVLCNVDFSDPSDPVFHGNLIALPGYCLDMALDSSYLYTCCNDFVVLYDYSTPTLPVQVSTIDFAPNNANEIEIMDPDGTNAHLVVAGDNALISYAITDPLSPVNEGLFPLTLGYFRNIVVRGNFIYINVNGLPDSALFIYEQLTDDIAYQGAYSFSDYTNFFGVSDNYAVIPHSGSVEVVDISDKTSPSHVGNVTTPGIINDVTVDEAGDYVFFCLADKGFEIDDISTYPWDGQFASSVINRAMDFTLFEIGANDYLAAADSESQYNRALRTVDITDPSNATVIDSYTLDFSSGNKLGYGNEIIAVTNGTPDFKLISAADPGNLLSTYDGSVPGSVYGYGFYGDTLYVSNLDYGLGDTLEIYDITIPAVPAFIGPFSITDYISSMTFIPDYLFAVQDSELYIYDITNPVNPSYVDNIVPVTSLATAIEVFGSNLYMLTETGLEIYDITTPSATSLLGSVVLYSSGYTLYFDIVEGDYAFIGGSGAGAPIVVDISDTANPHKVMSLDCYSNNVYRIHVLNGYLYISILYDGIRIYRIDY